MKIDAPFEKTHVLTTICIRSFNRIGSLQSAVDSCLKQTRPANVLIIDDGSQKPTVELIRKLVNSEMRVEAIFLEKNLGPSNATNVAIESVRTRYMGFLDSDDLLDEHYVQEFECALKSHSRAAVAYCRFQGGPRWALEGVDVFRQVLRQGSLSAHGTIFGRTDAFRAIPKLPTRSEIRFDFCDDDRLSFELARRFEVIHVPRDLYIYQVSADERLTYKSDEMFGSFSRLFFDYSYDYKQESLLFSLGSHHANIYMKYRPSSCGPIQYAVQSASSEKFGPGKLAIFLGYLTRLLWESLVREKVKTRRTVQILLVRIKRLLQ